MRARSLTALFPLLCVALATSALAQSTFYLPKGWEKPQLAFVEDHLGASASYMPVHLQHLYATADLPSAPFRLQQVAYRRNNWFKAPIYASTQTLTLAMSHAATEPTTPSNTFASNEGADRTVVFDGTLNWPAADYSGPDSAPFAFVIKLSTPFLVDASKGKSLTLDYRIKSRDHKDASNNQLEMYFDAAWTDVGRLRDNGPWPTNCKFSNNSYNSMVLYNVSGLTPNGGTSSIAYVGLLPNAPGAMTFSAYGIANRGSWPLPIDLAAAGAPGCAWHVGLETGIWLPFQADSTGWGSDVKFPVPPGLPNVKFYTHGLVVDAKANALGAVTTMSAEWRIGTGNKPAAAIVYKMRDTASSATGDVFANFVAILEGQY